MAIVNHTWKFIYIHIPKCGGTTVAHALEPLCSYRDLVLGGTPFGEHLHRAYQRRFGIAKHSLGSEIRRLVGNETWTEYTKIVTVRDPVERTISAFRYLKQHELHYTFMQEISSISGFLRHDIWKDGGPDRMFLPQHRWLFEEQGQKQQLADVVIPLSELHTALPKALEQAGVPQSVLGRVDLQHKNKSSDVAYPELKAEDRELIASRYALDTFEMLSRDRYTD